jgi:hypothetical protein
VAPQLADATNNTQWLSDVLPNTGEQNSPFYTFFPHFAGRMGLHFGDFPKFIFSEWGEGFGEAVWGNIRQNGVYSPFCVFF